jgi:hypothetical protein
VSLQHYDGDMEDLCLTFSFEEEFLGKVIKHLTITNKQQQQPD